MSRPAVVFIGFMGAGKSTALAAAREAGLETTEIDALMEGELGMPIAKAFEEHGEEAFRAREAEVVGELLEGADGGAIALGGGSVLSERVRAALGRHIVVLLELDADEAWRRIAHSNRPLANSAEDVSRLLDVRRPIYEELADAIVPARDRAIVGRALPSIRALEQLPQGTRLLWASSRSGEYPIFVGSGLLEANWWPLAGGRFCVSDTNVGAAYADRLAPLAARIEVEPGEGAKTMAEAERVLRELARAAMTREDHVVALGGGVVGDLAGFCAHTYQRGVPVVGVPTSLVAQVDSAYGGKTGVDLPEGKNYAGAYHLPAAVLSDTATLATLPPTELAAGFVEVLKTGLLAGGELWERVRGPRAPRSRAARRDRLRLRPLQVRRRRRRRARRRPAPRPQPRAHGGPRDRGRQRLLALPPWRGGRHRPAGLPAALRGPGARRAGRGDPSPPRAARLDRPLDRPGGRPRGAAAGQEADLGGSRLRPALGAG